MVVGGVLPVTAAGPEGQKGAELSSQPSCALALGPKLACHMGEYFYAHFFCYVCE